MADKFKNKLYIVSVILFVICAICMLYFGYKTFYMKADSSDVKEYTYHFALIAEETDNEYWDMIHKGAEQTAEAHDIYLDYIAPQKADNDEALTLIDRMISAKVDGIITQGIEGERFVEIVHKGIERGIPIITIDTDVTSSERKAYVGSDNHKAGQQLGQAVVDSSDKDQYIGVVTGRKDSVSQQERIEGLKEVIQSHSNIEIVAIEESNITQIGAAQATYTLLKEHPNITTLIGTSALDGIGIVEGIEEIAPNEDIPVIAFDTLPATLQLMQDGAIDMTVEQQPKEMGREAIKLMLGLQENDLLDNERYIDTKLIRKQDVQKDDDSS